MNHEKITKIPSKNGYVKKVNINGEEFFASVSSNTKLVIRNRNTVINSVSVPDTEFISSYLFINNYLYIFATCNTSHRIYCYNTGHPNWPLIGDHNLRLEEKNDIQLEGEIMPMPDNRSVAMIFNLTKSADLGLFEYMIILVDRHEIKTKHFGVKYRIKHISKLTNKYILCLSHSELIIINAESLNVLCRRNLTASQNIPQGETLFHNAIIRSGQDNNFDIYISQSREEYYYDCYELNLKSFSVKHNHSATGIGPLSDYHNFHNSIIYKVNAISLGNMDDATGIYVYKIMPDKRIRALQKITPNHGSCSCFECDIFGGGLYSLLDIDEEYIYWYLRHSKITIYRTPHPIDIYYSDEKRAIIQDILSADHPAFVNITKFVVSEYLPK